MQNTEDVLQSCTVMGTTVKLPNVQLDRKLYQQVKQKLELIGGKWKGGKIAGFVFAEDPSELLAQIAAGEKRNIKKEYQFYATSEALSDKLVEIAAIRQGDEILEPSAGQGAIVKAINRKLPRQIVSCYELMTLNQTFLKKIPTVRLLGDDFLKADERMKYDRIIANPPFANNQDIDHIRKMYNLLAYGGRLVSIASEHWTFSKNRKETEFKEWLYDLNAGFVKVEQGAFKESGTMMGGRIIFIDKKV